jgi:hypothetical protein
MRNSYLICYDISDETRSAQSLQADAELSRAPGGSSGAVRSAERLGRRTDPAAKATSSTAGDGTGAASQERRLGYSPFIKQR